MKKKVLFFGCAFHAVIPLLEEFRDDNDFVFIPVIDAERLHPSYYEGGPSPYKNLPSLFDACVVRSCGQNDVNKLLDMYLPDYVFVRCWTKFSKFNILQLNPPFRFFKFFLSLLTFSDVFGEN